MWMDVKLILMTVKTMLKKDATEGINDDQTTGLHEVSEGNENVERMVKEYVSGGRTKDE